MYVILRICLIFPLALGLINCSHEEGGKSRPSYRNQGGDQSSAGAEVDVEIPVEGIDGVEVPVVVDPVVDPLVDPVPPPVDGVLPPIPLPPPPIIDGSHKGNPDDDHKSCQESDKDGDGVCDEDDKCPGFNDKADADGDGDPDACDCDPEDPEVFNGSSCTPSSEAVPSECQEAQCIEGECVIVNVANMTRCGPKVLEGPCDEYDVCMDGVCADLVRDSRYVCKSQEGRLGERGCNPVDTCDGTSKECPNVLAEDGTICDLPRSDEEERFAQFPCASTSGECRSGLCVLSPAPAGTVCRDAEDAECDIAETCDGVSYFCPDDSFTDEGVFCGPTDPQGACDLQDTCDGQGNCVENVDMKGTVCSQGSDICNPPTFCNGITPECPEQTFSPEGTRCGLFNAGECDGSGECVDPEVPSINIDKCTNGDGSEPDADSDGFSSACDCDDTDANIRPGTPCGDTGNDCTVSLCPRTDGFFESIGTCIILNRVQGTRCETGDPLLGPCQEPPTCDGDGTCLVSNDYAAGKVCRPAAGPCDIEETCRATCPDEDPGCDLNQCPDDLLAEAGQDCSVAENPCVTGGTCDGATASCPSGSTLNGSPNSACTTEGFANDSCNNRQGIERCYDQVDYCYPVSQTQCTEGTESFAGSEADERLGTSVTTFGEFSATGSPNATVSSEAQAGKVQIFQYQSDDNADVGGSVFQTLTADDFGSGPGATAGAKFGTSVSMWDDVLVVGAPFEESSGTQVGAIYVYVYDGSVWQPTQRIVPALNNNLTNMVNNFLSNTPFTFSPPGFGNSQFGRSISLSGQRLIIGAPGSRAALVTNPSSQFTFGMVATYQHDGNGNFTSVSALFATANALTATQSSNPNFGVSVSTSQDGWLAVGDPGSNTIHVWDSTPTKIGSDVLSGTNNHGTSISINNRYVVSGGPTFDNTNGQVGSVHVYPRDDLGVTPDIIIPPTSLFADSFFGMSVALDRGPNSRNALSVAAPGYTGAGGVMHGAVLLYAIPCVDSIDNNCSDDFDWTVYSGTTPNVLYGETLSTIDQNIDAAFGSGPQFLNQSGNFTVNFAETQGTDINVNKVIAGAAFDRENGLAGVGSVHFFFYPN